MADRTVKVSLVLAAQGYMQGMDAAAKKTREMGSEAEKLTQKREAFNVLGTAALGFGAAAAAGVGMAVAKFADFDQAMSYVQAATHETAGNMNLLRDAALDAGARTVFSATEAANAIEELSKAGVSTADILSGGLDAALDLAAAGGMGVADAAAVAATTLKQFQLQGKDASHIADLLAAGAGKAQGDVSDMSQALKQGGLVANQFGLSVDETVGTLSAFASAGMLGSDAGTSFRTMLLRLANPTGESADKMKELGINAYDAQGKFVGMVGLTAQLENGLKGLTDQQRSAALAVIFGQDAYRAANVLLQQGADGIAEWTEKVNDQGYAAETAAIRLDNLKGDIEQLGGALDTAFISMGQGANGPLRELVQGLTGLVDGFNDLPDWAKQSALGVGGLTATVGLAGGAFLLAVPKVAAFKSGLEALGMASTRTDRILGLLGKTAAAGSGLLVGLALAKGGADLLSAAFDNMGESAEKAQNALATAASGAEVFSAATGRGFGVQYSAEQAERAVNGLAGALDRLRKGTSGGASQDEVFAVSSLGRLSKQLDTLAHTDLPAAQRSFRALAEDAGLTDKQILTLIDQLPGYKAVLTETATQSGKAADAQTLVNLALGEAPEATGAAADGMSVMEEASTAAERALSDVVQALQDVAAGALNMGDAKDKAQSALNGLAEAAKNGKASLSGTNDESIRFRDSLREVEQASRDSAQAILENGGSLDEANASWVANRQAVIDTMVAKGMDREEAIRWADQNLGSAQQVRDALYGVKSAMDAIPARKDAKVVINTSEAQRGLDQWIAAGSNRVIRVRIAADGGSFTVGGIKVTPNATGNLYEKGKVKDFAAGGWASGVGMFSATSGGLMRIVEAGHDEAVVSTDPKYRARSIDIVNDMAGRLGMWQYGSPSVATPQVSVAAPSLDGVRMELVLDDGTALSGFVRAQAAGQVRAHSERFAADLRSRRRSDA